jgi:TFIIF-interacting CTD phosphatase-like protein
MHILCDLDATLINSLSVKGELEYAPKEFQKQFTYIDMKNYYRIFERPYLQFFLDFLFANFDVSIFTAADKDYALFISDNIVLKKPGRALKYLFYGYASGLSEGYYKSPKDLRLLWDVFQLKEFNPCSTVIIDDLKEVFDANPNNTIAAPKFELLTSSKKPDLSQAHDNFLLSIIPKLERAKERFSKTPCAHFFGQTHANPCSKPCGLLT